MTDDTNTIDLRVPPSSLTWHTVRRRDGILELNTSFADEPTPDESLVVLIRHETDGSLYLEVPSESFAVYVHPLSASHDRTKVRPSISEGSRVYALIIHDIRLQAEGLQGTITIHRNRKRPTPPPIPRVLVEQSMTQHENANSVPETLTNPDHRVYETPAVKSRHIHPDSSPRRPRDYSPSDARVVTSKSGLMKISSSGAGFPETQSDDEGAELMSTAGLDKVMGTPGVEISASAGRQAPVADMGADTNMTSPDATPDVTTDATPSATREGQNSGKPKDASKHLGDGADNQNSLPEVFDYVDRRDHHTPAKKYGKRGTKRTTAEPTENHTKRRKSWDSSPVEKEEPAPTKKPPRGTKRGRPRAMDSEDPESTAEAIAFSTGPEPSPSVEPEAEPDLPKPKRGKASKVATPKPKPKTVPRKRASPPPSKGGNTQYTFNDEDDDDGNEREEGKSVLATLKTPKARGKITKKTTTPSVILSTKKKSPQKATSNSSLADHTPALSTLRTTDHYEGDPPRLCFTGSDLHNKKPIASFIKTHQGKSVPSVSDASCNFLVVGPGELKRTPKLIVAVARGLIIVSEEWLEESQVAGHWLDPDPYFPKDPEREKQWDAVLQDAVERGQKGQNFVLKGKTVYLTPSLVSQLRAGSGLESGLVEMVTAAGGTVIKKAPRGEKVDDAMVLGKDEGDKDYAVLTKAGWTVFKAAVVGIGVLRGEIKESDEEFWAVEGSGEEEKGAKRGRKAR